MSWFRNLPVELLQFQRIWDWSSVFIRVWKGRTKGKCNGIILVPRDVLGILSETKLNPPACESLTLVLSDIPAPDFGLPLR